MKTLYYFSAPWCGPCRTMGPIVAELAEELAGELEVKKINVDQDSATASEFQVSAVPCFVLVEDSPSDPRKIHIGRMQKPALRSWITGNADCFKVEE